MLKLAIVPLAAALIAASGQTPPAPVPTSMPAPAPSTPPATTATTAAPLPVIRLATDESRRMTVDVMLEGQGPFPFLVDTGSESTVVSRELAGQLALRPAGPARLIGVTGSQAVELVHIDALAIDAHRATKLRAPMLAEAQIGGSGMIGIDSLQRHRVTMDFRKRAMTIEPSQKRAQRAPVGSDDIVVQGRSLLGRLVITRARIDGQRVTLVLDTGSQMSIGNEMLRRRLAQRRDAAELPVLITDVNGGQLRATYSVARRVRIEDFEVNDLPLALVDAPIFAFLGLDDEPALLLGMDAMHLFERVSIDFARREARFRVPVSG